MQLHAALPSSVLILTPRCRVFLEKLTPHISRNPKVHYRTHKLPPPVPILCRPNPVHIPTSHLLENRPYMLRDVSPRNTPPPGRSEWGSSLLPDCFVFKASILICACFLTWVFYRVGLLAPRPTPKLEDRPSSATVYSIYSQLPSISQAVPLSATWGRAMPWWQ